MPSTVDKRVSFQPADSDDRVFLTLAGDWTFSGGLEPNVNTAEIPYTERVKLPPNLIYVSGTINFHGPNDPDDEPEHHFVNQWLVDCVVSRRGREPGDSADKALAYTLSFADLRQGFKPPRGGRLTAGLGNPDPLGSAMLINNSTLIGSCLAAMGVAASVPSSVNAVAAKRQLEWFGAPAAGELGELLQHTGHVCCLQSDGGVEIWRLGNGELPEIPADRLISDITASSVSRLPRTAVFTSCPGAEARTYNQDGGDLPAWEFVVQDPASGYAWTELASVTALGSNAATALARGFPAAAEKDRKQLGDQVFKVIRLKGNRYDCLQCPLLREVLYPDGRVDQPHLVATVAVQASDGAWINRQTRLNANTVDGASNLLAFDTRLGKVSGGDERATLDANFTPLAAADLKPTFTVEDYNTTDGKRFSVYGFTIGVGSVAAISEALARGKLRGYRPEVAILDVPELRAVWLNDDTSNRDTLNGQAQGLAEALLVESNNARTIEITGYFPWEIDGRTNEVKYSQAGYRTTITIDGWAAASRGGRSGRVRGREDNSDDPRHQQGRSHQAARTRSHAQQIRRGGSAARQTSTPANPVPPPQTGWRPAIATIGDCISGQLGRAKATTRSGKLNTSASGAYVAGDVGTAGTADDLILYGAGHQKLPLAKGHTALVLIGPAMDGTSTPIAAAIPMPQLHMVKVYKDGGVVGTATTASTWTYTVKTIDGLQFATAVPVYKARSKGNLAFAADGSLGWVFYDGDTLKLWDVNESFGAAGC